jgi:UDP-GlcNAc:undecaprenyl-phosphate/decaprenyl-phosphate GlcNAc-1-phosphate transferase
MELFTVFIFSLFLTIALVPIFNRVALKMNIMDVPDPRKVHTVPMPKTGGIAIAIGAFVPILLLVSRDHFFSSILIGAVLIVLFGLVDDIKVLSAKQKIIPQVAAALVVILFGGVRIIYLGDFAPDGYILPGYLSVPLTLIVILGVTNAINLADGLDGLAGGISMLSFILIAFLAYMCENFQIAVMAMALVGAILGFLRYNTHPAVLFMGDAGSQLLGFLSIVFAIVLSQANTPYARVLPLSIIGFPILDTLFVMADRVIRKKTSPFKADKNHFHHRLLRFGLFHSEAVLTIYIIQACFIAMALVFRYYSSWVHVFGFIALSFLILASNFTARARDFQFRRDGGFDTNIKNRLKVLKEKNIFIRLSFGGLRYGFPLVLACQALIPKEIPTYLSFTALFLAILIGAANYFNFERWKESVLRCSIYIVAPFLIFVTQNSPGNWMQSPWIEMNNFAFLCIAVFMILTLNLTRRRQGFKISPLDILVLIVILVFPNLPSLNILKISGGIFFAKVLIVFFSYDVLAGELRRNPGGLAKLIMVLFLFLTLRGFTGQ